MKFNNLFDNLSINSAKSKAQEYILCENQNDLGVIALSKESFETIAKITIEEFDEIASETKHKKSVVCRIRDNQLQVFTEIKLKYGTDLNNLTKMLQEKIYQNILEMTGFKTDLIDVKVTGFEF